GVTPFRKRWTRAEDAAMRRHYGPGPEHLTAAEIARRLGRTVKSIHEHAKFMGLVYQSRADTSDPAFDSGLRRLHAVGHTDPEIAGSLGCERHTVSLARRRLGLPSNRGGERHRRNVAARTADQCRAAGVRSLAEVRSLAFARRAAEAGWPADMPPRCCQILDAMEARGPMTRREIAEAIGATWIGSRRSLKGRVPGG
ncbi:hypothetical protein B7486_74185, partial [cyanobacterium TDX16]